jgi:uncharacterized membrane protein YdjX (TVP38/TMEM64 family)
VSATEPSVVPISAPRRSWPWARWLGFATLSVSVWTLVIVYRDQLTLETLVRQEAALRHTLATSPGVVYVSTAAVYVAVTALSLPGATVLTLGCGWLLGFWPGLMLVSLASTTGATLAFLLSRYLFRDYVQARYGERLTRFNEALAREGAFYLFTLRLTPAVPYFVVNVVMGLTPLRTWTYWWVSQVGMLPVTALFVWAGASVPSAAVLAERGASGILTPQLVIALTLIGLLPLLARWGLQAWRRRTAR